MKTPIEKLIDLLEEDGYHFDTDIINNALFEEKCEIIAGVSFGFKDALSPKPIRTFEDYYTKRFKNK